MAFLAPDPAAGNFSFGLQPPRPEGWELPNWMSSSRHANYFEAVRQWASLLKRLAAGRGPGADEGGGVEISDEDREVISAQIINSGNCGGMQV